MEPGSIITQVNREEDCLNSQQDNGQLPDARVSKPRSLLRSLLCCLGRGHGSRSSSPTPAPEENGHSAAPPGQPPPGHFLLPPVRHQDMGRVCLVVDLDETLVHSSFKPIANADFIVPVEIDGTVHQVYVLKRPHVDDFLQRIGDLFECVLFTASLAKYADPVADLLDKRGVFRSRLFRESCVFYRGNYVKDLERLGRDLRRVVIVDNSPASYIFHPDNAVACRSWFDDMADTELLERLPLMEALSRVEDIYTVLGREPPTDSLSDSPPPPAAGQPS